jgi:hypothetical protein
MDETRLTEIEERHDDHYAIIELIAEVRRLRTLLDDSGRDSC